MDTAKGTNFLLTNGGVMKDYWGVGKATRPMLPLIAIQQYALQQLQTEKLSPEEAEVYQKMVLRSMFGIINAARNAA